MGAAPHVAYEAARRVALAELIPGASVDDAREVALAELSAFGFPPASRRVAVRGVGLSAREAPTVGESVPAAALLAVDLAVSDSEEGTVRIGDLVAVAAGEDDGGTVGENDTAVEVEEAGENGQDGAQPVVDAPLSLSPSR